MVTTMAVKKFLALVLSLLLSMGIITGPAADDPITLKDSESVELCFAAVSDTHIQADSFSAQKFSNLFTDIDNSKINPDALVIAGDLVNNGCGCEYDALFDILDSQTTFDKIILASGNHDARYFYDRNSKLINAEIDKLLGIQTNGKPYYAYDINGFTFIVLGTEKAVFERAYLSDAQLAFLDSELARATAEGKPAFVICHQPLKNTHGLPDVWPTGDLGDQSEQVRNILTKYQNVFFINGHLHDGVYERSVEKLADGVFSINLPTYGKSNDFGIKDAAVGYIVEVYDDEVIFSARNFAAGEHTDAVFTFALV